MNKLLSIIIPVYNGEKYIEKCLNSVLNQTYTNIEVIIINDGSNDKSYEKLRAYSQDKRVVLVNQDNQGTSRTRNKALSLATGDYVTFVDIDDYIDIKTYKSVFDKMIDDCDIVSFGANYVYQKENYTIEKTFDYCEQKQEVISKLFENGIFNPLWNKIYKKEVIENIIFPIDFNQGEDLIFNCQVYQKAIKIQHIKESFYYYVYKQEDTMISRFTPNYDKVITYKDKCVKEVLAFNQQLYKNYMLKEYEIFVINLMLKESPYNFKQKCTLIKTNVLSNILLIKHAQYNNFYGKIFKIVALTKNEYIICIVYQLLMISKKTLGNLYLNIRKKIYMKGTK